MPLCGHCTPWENDRFFVLPWWEEQRLVCGMPAWQPGILLSGCVTLIKSFNLFVPQYSHFRNEVNSAVRSTEELGGERALFYYQAALELSFKMLSSVTSSGKPSWTTGMLGSPMPTLVRGLTTLPVILALCSYFTTCL